MSALDDVGEEMAIALANAAAAQFNFLDMIDSFRFSPRGEGKYIADLGYSQRDFNVLKIVGSQSILNARLTAKARAAGARLWPEGYE
jgi:hypothetical protein